MAIAILPAAGRASRMGAPKALLPWGQGTVLTSVLDTFDTAGVSETVLVTRPDDEELRAAGGRAGARVVVNPRPERGMLSSVRCGLDAVASLDDVLVCPVDHPGLAPATVRGLIAALAEGAQIAVPVHAGRRGHPLAVSASLLPRIHALDPTVGLRQLLTEHASVLREVEVDDPGCVRDLDTPADYRRLRDELS